MNKNISFKLYRVSQSRNYWYVQRINANLAYLVIKLYYVKVSTVKDNTETLFKLI